MRNEKIYQMSFIKIYNLLLDKIKRKGRTEEELQLVIEWLTGYKKENLEQLLKEDISYGNFFLNAPLLNPKRKLIKGRFCNVKLESISDPLMLEIRYLDKLVDDLAKGKSVEKILL